MLGRLLIAGAALAGLASPIAAQAVDEWYVVQDRTTKRCSIVERRPTTESIVVVGPHGYPTRAEAETGMKTVQVCETR